MLHVEVSRITADPCRLADAVSYLTSEVRPVTERQPGNPETLLLLDPEAGAMGFESFWASNGALMDSGDVIAASVREATQRAGRTMTRERYAVLVFERGGTAARRTGRAGDTDGSVTPPGSRAGAPAAIAGLRQRHVCGPART